MKVVITLFALVYYCLGFLVYIVADLRDSPETIYMHQIPPC